MWICEQLLSFWNLHTIIATLALWNRGIWSDLDASSTFQYWIAQNLDDCTNHLACNRRSESGLCFVWNLGQGENVAEKVKNVRKCSRKCLPPWQNLDNDLCDHKPDFRGPLYQYRLKFLLDAMSSCQLHPTHPVRRCHPFNSSMSCTRRQATMFGRTLTRATSLLLQQCPKYSRKQEFGLGGYWPHCTSKLRWHRIKSWNQQ